MTAVFAWLLAQSWLLDKTRCQGGTVGEIIGMEEGKEEVLPFPAFWQEKKEDPVQGQGCEGNLSWTISHASLFRNLARSQHGRGMLDVGQ